jgi:hypothetical protein
MHQCNTERTAGNDTAGRPAGDNTAFKTAGPLQYTIFGFVEHVLANFQGGQGSVEFFQQAENGVPTPFSFIFLCGRLHVRLNYPSCVSIILFNFAITSSATGVIASSVDAVAIASISRSARSG